VTLILRLSEAEEAEVAVEEEAAEVDAVLSAKSNKAGRLLYRPLRVPSSPCMREDRCALGGVEVRVSRASMLDGVSGTIPDREEKERLSEEEEDGDDSAAADGDGRGMGVERLSGSDTPPFSSDGM
jgi:hypothetical protein